MHRLGGNQGTSTGVSWELCLSVCLSILSALSLPRLFSPLFVIQQIHSPKESTPHTLAMEPQEGHRPSEDPPISSPPCPAEW